MDLPKLRWSEDDTYFHIDDICFAEVREEVPDPAIIPGENCFPFHKDRALVEEYLGFFGLQAEAPPANIVELGLFDGGSIPFWVELFQPSKHVGIDIQNREDLAIFTDYVEERGIADRIETHWRTDQADKARLAQICDAAFGEHPIDLVIDDASHWYDETLASFEALFPRLRPGGLYVIEDWAWLHWKELEGVWDDKGPLTQLITQLAEAIGSNRAAFEEMIVHGGFAAVRRGPAVLDDAGFTLEGQIHRHRRPASRRRRLWSA